MTTLTQCDGYKSLRAAVDRDYETEKDRNKPFHNYEEKFAWVIERAQQYAAALDLPASDILDAWESARNYWYMNYYQESQQPKIGGGAVRVFDTVADLKTSIAKPRFRCPACAGVSNDPHVCDSGVLKDGSPCNWKSYGLLGTLGKGVFVYVKSELRGESIFMPVAWEKSP